MSRNPEAPGAAPPQLRRLLGTWDAVALIVGVMIGSGIFATPPLVAGHLQSVGPVLLVWLAGGLLALCGALCYAELTALFPHTGGAYVFLREGYGRLPAFSFGWCALLVTYPASIAAVSLVFTTYLGRLVPELAPYRAVSAAALCVGLTALNIVGVRAGAWTLRAITSAKVLALAAVIGVALAGAARTELHLAPLWRSPEGGWTAAALALSLVSVLWTYEGWADGPTIAGETRHAERDVVRALLLSTTALTVLYVAANLAYLAVLGVDGVGASESVAVDVMRPLLGAAGGVFVSVLVLVSTLGSILGMIIAGSRVVFAMGRDGLFFEVVGRIHPRFGTPAVALGVLGLVAAFYSVIGSFETIIRYFVFVANVWFVLIIASVIVHRVRRPEAPRPFRVPLYPLPVVAYLIVASGLVVELARGGTRDALAGAGILAASVPAYWTWRAVVAKVDRGERGG